MRFISFNLWTFPIPDPSALGPRQARLHRRFISFDPQDKAAFIRGAGWRLLWSARHQDLPQCAYAASRANSCTRAYARSSSGWLWRNWRMVLHSSSVRSSGRRRREKRHLPCWQRSWEELGSLRSVLFPECPPTNRVIPYTRIRPLVPSHHQFLVEANHSVAPRLPPLKHIR
jgi:hypothetical protein